MTARRYCTPEPQIVPAPFEFWCPACGDEVDEDDPVAWVHIEGLGPPLSGRSRFLVCQDCACGEPEQ